MKKAEVCRIRKLKKNFRIIKDYLIFFQRKIYYSDLLELFKKGKVEKNGDVFNALGTLQNKNHYKNYF